MAATPRGIDRLDVIDFALAAESTVEEKSAVTTHSIKPRSPPRGKSKPDPKTKKSAHKETENKKQGSLSKFTTKATKWLKISEPSATALEEFRKAEFRRNHVEGMMDPLAAAKLKIPSAKLPVDAIRPSGRGPEPEDIARKKHHDKMMKAPGTGSSCGSNTGSPSFSTCKHSFDNRGSTESSFRTRTNSFASATTLGPKTLLCILGGNVDETKGE